MIWRIRERAAFDRLTSTGRRARAGALWCTFLLDESADPPRVAFSIGRAFGPAVARNRVRRQLRSILGSAPLPPGWYLIGVRPTTSPDFHELTFDIGRLMQHIQAAAGSCSE